MVDNWRSSWNRGHYGHPEVLCLETETHDAPRTRLSDGWALGQTQYTRYHLQLLRIFFCSELLFILQNPVLVALPLPRPSLECLPCPVVTFYLPQRLPGWTHVDPSAETVTQVPKKEAFTRQMIQESGDQWVALTGSISWVTARSASPDQGFSLASDLSGKDLQAPCFCLPIFPNPASNIPLNYLETESHCVLQAGLELQAFLLLQSFRMLEL